MRNLQHADDNVHGRADFVAHARKKFGFRFVRSFGCMHGVFHRKLNRLLGGLVLQHDKQLVFTVEYKRADRIPHPLLAAVPSTEERDLAALGRLDPPRADAIEQGRVGIRKSDGGRQSLVVQKVGQPVADDIGRLFHNGRHLPVRWRVQVDGQVDALRKRVVELGHHGYVALAQALAIRRDNQETHRRQTSEHDQYHDQKRRRHEGRFGSHVLHGHDSACIPPSRAHRRNAYIAGLAIDRGCGQTRMLLRHSIFQSAQVASHVRRHDEQRFARFFRRVEHFRRFIARCLVQKIEQRHALADGRFGRLVRRNENLSRPSLEQHKVPASVEHIQFRRHREQIERDLHIQRADCCPSKNNGRWAKRTRTPSLFTNVSE